MNRDFKIKELIILFSFLQNYIKNHTKSSFNDISFSIEMLIIDIFNELLSEKGKFFNINMQKHNYPAIDLVNEEDSIAVQVTVDASKTKVKKTIKEYEKSKVKYKRLIIIGFCSATKSKVDGVEIESIDFVINIAKHQAEEKIEKIIQILHSQIPLNLLNPLKDEICFEIVFDVLNRSAIRDLGFFQGDFDRMVIGLDEIKQIITSGKIFGKDIIAKPLSQYNEPYHSILENIETMISGIIQIVNIVKNRNNNYKLDLYQESNSIDKLKIEIIEKVNEFCKQNNIQREIKIPDYILDRYKKLHNNKTPHIQE
jgi:hypothetical protein